MRRFLTRRPAPGTVLGLVALFVALGGVASGQGTTPGTTTPGTTTTTTPAGSPPVPEAIHAQSASRAPLSRVVYVTESEEAPNESGSSSSIRISCPGDMKVIGGGLTTTGGGGSRDTETRFSGPTSENSWEVRYQASTRDDGETFRGTAICADVVESHTAGTLR